MAEGLVPKPPGGGIIMSMAFSADGLLLAAGDSKGAAHVWAKKPTGWGFLASLKGHEGDVVACRWATQKSDGYHLMTAAHDKDVKFWAPKDGQLANAWSTLATYHTQHKEALSECLWLQRGSACAIVTASGDKTVRVHARTGKNLSDWVCCAVLSGHTDNVCGATAALDDDGMLSIATVSFDKTARVWTSAKAFEELLQERVKAGQHPAGWSVTTLEDAKVTPHGGDKRIAFCPSDEALLALTTDKEIQIWERWEGEGGAGAKWERSAVLSGFEGYINSLSFRSDGMLLAGVDHVGHLRIFSREAEPGVVEGTWRGVSTTDKPKGTLWSCAFGSLCTVSLLVAGGFSGEPLVTDTAELALVQSGRIKGRDALCEVDVRGRLLAVALLCKADGNALFKDKKYMEGIACYKAAIGLLEDEQGGAGAGPENEAEDGFVIADIPSSADEDATELKTTCHCNIAACALNAEQFLLAEEHCRVVLGYNDKHPKANYRLGMALMGQERLDEAQAALDVAKGIMGADDPQMVTALRQVEMSKVWLYFGVGQDGSFVIDDPCYSALRDCAPDGKKAEFDDFSDLITALHTGQLQLTKDGDQPPELSEIVTALENSIGVDEIHQIAWDAFEALESVQPALPFCGKAPEPQAGMGCVQYVLEYMDLSAVDDAVKKDAGYMVPPGDKWPLNNGFIRILPLLGYHRVLYPEPADIAVYTTGYVVERDKIGFVRGQACHAGLVVEVERGSAGGELKTGSVTVQV